MTGKEMSKGKNLSSQSLIVFIQEARAKSKTIHDHEERKRQYSSGEYFLHILQKNYLEKLSFNLFQLQCCILNSKSFCTPKLHVFQA